MSAKSPRTPLEHMGGATGLVYAMLPVVAFVLTNASFGLVVATCSAVGVALVVTVLRLVRREPVLPALFGLSGVALASLIAWTTGSARAYFLLGIWSNLALGVLFFLSIVVRRPLAGVVWGALNGAALAWVKDKPSRLYYNIATLTLVAVFLGRFLVQQWLFHRYDTGWLAVAKIIMGYPLFGLAFLVVLWAARRSAKRLKAAVKDD